MRALSERKGYCLVHAELCGVNAFFVRQDLADGRFAAVDDVLLRGAPNYFQHGQGHPPDVDRRPYLDLDSGELVSVEPPADVPTPPLQDELSAWRERALSAEEHLESSRQYATDAGVVYESTRKDYENAMAALATSQRQSAQQEHRLHHTSTLLAERNEALRLAGMDLTELHAQVAELEARLDASTTLLASLRASLSWRITAPLRVLGGTRRDL
jgi:hypothetical protein